MDGYLLDTGFLSALLDPRNPRHEAAVSFANTRIPAGSPIYVSVIAVGELMYGKQLAEADKGQPLPTLDAVLQRALTYPLLDVTKHTAAEYAWVKTRLATTYLRKALGKERKRWVEDWVNIATGKALQVDENDLWMHAQARERGLIILTADKKQERITAATGERWLLVDTP